MLSIRVPLWLLLIPCLGMAAISVVRAQAPEAPKEAPKGEEPLALSEYPYLPTRYGEAFIPSVAEWRAMQLTALGSSRTRITEEFSRHHLVCFATPKGLVLTLDLAPEAGWKLSAPGGKFTAPVAQVKPALQKAVDVSYKFLLNFFPEVRKENVSIRVFINHENVGLYEKGQLTLNAERPAEAPAR